MTFNSSHLAKLLLSIIIIITNRLLFWCLIIEWVNRLKFLYYSWKYLFPATKQGLIEPQRKKTNRIKKEIVFKK